MSRIKNKIVLVLLLIPIWIVVYKYLQEISDFIVFRIFQMPPEKHLTETLRFFIYEVPKVLLLLVLKDLVQDRLTSVLAKLKHYCIAVKSVTVV